MAIYHFTANIISRSSGKSAVAAAAYRSATRITNDYDGIEHDYTRKNWVEHTEILLPQNAPPEYKDRATLWNSVEAAERSSRSQLCRDLEIALPQELSIEDNISLITEFIKDIFVDDGMCADIAVHNPPVMDDLHRPITDDGYPTYDRDQMQFVNPHAHVLLTLRPIDARGKWESKSSIEYLCKNNGQEKAFTAAELKLPENEVWERQFRYLTPDGKKIWMTPSEAGTLDLQRVNRTPKTTPFGRKNPKVAYWNSKERIPEWREKWAEYVNRELRRHGITETIDHRSFLDQGREFELPTTHLGPSATAMERRARREKVAGVSNVVRSDIAEINEEIRKHNKLVKDLMRQLDVEIERIHQEEKDQEERSRKISELSDKLQEAVSRRNDLEKAKCRLASEIDNKGRYVETGRNEIHTLMGAIRAKQGSIHDLYKEYNSAISARKKKQLRHTISVEEETLNTLQTYLKNLKNHYGIAEDGTSVDEKELQRMETEQSSLNAQVKKEEAIIEETTEIIQTLAEGSEIGSEALTMAGRGSVEIIKHFKEQQRKSETRRRR